MKVGEILKAKGDMVVTTLTNAPVGLVMQQMKRYAVGAMVVTADRDRIAGIISERDIVRGLAEYGAGLPKMRVADLMSRAVKTCTPRDNLKQVMSIMTRGRVRHLPVIDDGRLCGIVSIGDVVKSLLDQATLEINVLRDSCAGSRVMAEDFV